MKQKVHLGIQKLEIMPGFGVFSYIYLGFLEFQAVSEAINWDLGELYHPFEVLNFWSTLVDLQVNIYELKAVSKGENGNYVSTESIPKCS